MTHAQVDQERREVQASMPTAEQSLTRSTQALGIGALALGAFALGATAIGALAIGRVAVDPRLYQRPDEKIFEPVGRRSISVVGRRVDPFALSVRMCSPKNSDLTTKDSKVTDN